MGAGVIEFYLMVRGTFWNLFISYREQNLKWIQRDRNAFRSVPLLPSPKTESFEMLIYLYHDFLVLCTLCRISYFLGENQPCSCIKGNLRNFKASRCKSWSIRGCDKKPWSSRCHSFPPGPLSWDKKGFKLRTDWRKRRTIWLKIIRGGEDVPLSESSWISVAQCCTRCCEGDII